MTWKTGKYCLNFVNFYLCQLLSIALTKVYGIPWKFWQSQTFDFNKISSHFVSFITEIFCFTNILQLPSIKYLNYEPVLGWQLFWRVFISADFQWLISSDWIWWSLSTFMAPSFSWNFCQSLLSSFFSHSWFVSLYVSPSICLLVSLSVYWPINSSIHQSVGQSLCWSICLSVHQSSRPSVHWSIVLSVCRSVSPSVCCSIGLSVHRSVGVLICQPADLSACPLSILLSVSTSVCAPISLSVCRYVPLSFCLFICICVHLSVWMAKFPFLHPPVCLSFCNKRAILEHRGKGVGIH